MQRTNWWTNCVGGPADERDPRTVLIQVAAQALAGQDRGAA